MPIIKQKYILRQHLRENPDRLYVFGDNMIGCGLGGQAKECRGEPNAVGIPTKHFPRNDDVAFFCDSDFENVVSLIDRRIDIIRNHIKIGGTVVVPSDGVGVGRAQLETKAPKIYEYIMSQLLALED